MKEYFLNGEINHFPHQKNTHKKLKLKVPQQEQKQHLAKLREIPIS